MKWRWLVLSILILGLLLFARFAAEHTALAGSWERVILFLGLIFIIEQTERRIIERLDRLEALIRNKDQ
jgi:hypothetical protein